MSASFHEKRYSYRTFRWLLQEETNLHGNNNITWVILDIILSLSETLYIAVDKGRTA